MALQWDEVLLVGEEEIDKQHRALFFELPPLLDACKRGNEPEAASKVMAFLEAYTATHFDAEEQLQKSYGYPDYVAHKAEHEKFRRQLSFLKKLLIAEGATLRFVMLISYIAYEWITRHAGTIDRSFAQFVRERKT